MCGIWGKISHSLQIAQEDIIPAVHRLAHRGPDGYSWFYEPNVALLHTRLSIIDLAGGTQPLRSFDKRFIGVVNGELYDYAAHRERLREAGIRFYTKSDSEVLLNLFALKGPEAFANLSGEFAYIFYDTQRHVFLFGRDLHGIKPLFMKRDGETLTLASEMKAVLTESPTFDPEYFENYLNRVLVPPQTAIQGVTHVLPGRMYCFNPKNQELTWVQTQNIPNGPELYLSREEHRERIRYEISNAVKRRMVADVEVGVYLSGGIDSALVAAMMVEAGGRPKAFTVGFSDSTLDETARATSIANHLGIDHEVIRLGPDTFLDSLDRSVVAFENPVANTHGAAKNLLASLASKKVKVVLSGEGADEWFGGYAYLRIRKLTQFLKNHPTLSKAAPKALSILLANEKGVAKGHLDGSNHQFESQIQKFFGGNYPEIFSRIPKNRVRNHLLNPNASQSLMSGLQSLADWSLLESKSRESFSLNRWLSIRTDLLHYILANLGDRQEMSHSLEGRTPFLDIQVAQAASQIPQNLLLRGLQEKSILKDIGMSYLPPVHAQQKKHAFFGPMQYLFMRKNQDRIQSSIRAAEKATPWLPWKNLNHLIFRKKVLTQDHLIRDLSASLRLIFYSTGVIATKLLEPQLCQPRGYKLPNNLEELRPHRSPLSPRTQNPVLEDRIKPSVETLF